MCAACHSLSLASFRDLEHIGYNEAEIKKIASDWKIPVPRSTRTPAKSPAARRSPSDTFPSPFANAVAARASNNNAFPPDLTLITKAREGGAAYIYSLLTGYRDANTYRNEHGEALPADAKPAAESSLQSLFREPQHRDAAAARSPTTR